MKDFFDNAGEKACPFKLNNSNLNAQKCIKDKCELWTEVVFKNPKDETKDVVQKACALKFNVQFSLRQSNLIFEIYKLISLMGSIKVEQPKNIITGADILNINKFKQ